MKTTVESLGHATGPVELLGGWGGRGPPVTPALAVGDGRGQETGPPLGEGACGRPGPARPRLQEPGKAPQAAPAGVLPAAGESSAACTWSQGLRDKGPPERPEGGRRPRPGTPRARGEESRVASERTECSGPPWGRQGPRHGGGALGGHSRPVPGRHMVGGCLHPRASPAPAQGLHSNHPGSGDAPRPSLPSSPPPARFRRAVPGRQAHSWVVSPVGRQVPPFWQGEGLQGTWGSSQWGPVWVGRQTQR